MLCLTTCFSHPTFRTVASLLYFFTQDWSLSLKNLFDAEWAVFVALGFSLHASPSQVAYHFKRMMKTLEWNQLDYLGTTMFKQWQETLADEEERRAKRERRREARRKRKEEQLLNLHIEIENEYRRKNERKESGGGSDIDAALETKKGKERPPEGRVTKKKIGVERRIRLFNRLRKSVSQERLANAENDQHLASTAHEATPRMRSTGIGIHVSPSMPTIATAFSHDTGTGIVAIDIPIQNDAADDASSIGADSGIRF